LGAKKRKDFFEDFGPEIFDNIEEIIKDFMEDFGESIPFVYGFSIVHRPGEEPEIREFGNFQEAEDNPYEEIDFSVEEKKSLIDVFEAEETVHVLGDFSEVRKEDLKLSASAQSLEIKVLEPEEYSETVELPTRVEPGSAKASYRNGVLEVIFKKELEEAPKSIDIS